MSKPNSAGEANAKVARVTLSLGLVVAAMAAGGAIYMYSTSGEASRSSTLLAQRESAWNPSASEAEHEHEEEPLPQGEPVRFTNPFDASEVFEFPPGTSQADAREAVANLLMERAVARQSENNRRPGSKGP